MRSIDFTGYKVAYRNRERRAPVDQFPIMITAAFVLGLGVRFVGLPPLVGFLLAGFGLNLAGYVSTPSLERAADLGVTILLFTIGLKLRVRTLLRPAVWGGATLHMAITVVLFGLLLFALPFGIFGTLDNRHRHLDHAGCGRGDLPGRIEGTDAIAVGPRIVGSHSRAPPLEVAHGA
jgi:hypothetical protein